MSQPDGYSGPNRCPHCKGEGQHPKENFKCGTCKGTGWISRKSKSLKKYD